MLELLILYLYVIYNVYLGSSLAVWVLGCSIVLNGITLVYNKTVHGVWIRRLKLY